MREGEGDREIHSTQCQPLFSPSHPPHKHPYACVSQIIYNILYIKCSTSITQGCIALMLLLFLNRHIWQCNCVTSSAMLKKTTLYLNGVVLNCLDKTQDMKMQSKTKKGKCLYWLMMTRHKYTSTTPHLASQMIIHLFFLNRQKWKCIYYQKIF